ncbi:cytochrome c maturation protein CcmE [Dongia soli]|uniref:Cytochrome c-type biogenesis protein CcmE n=1 Tax=Dongia soli TaxID=600628 RepID=A0ABU5E6G1_9PROT|nr:cytochrome c maturation protein CcmE [Dongia soli]MDY0881877.1 cytochrome c maturation protein CcmE [Dongia soli]
MTRKTRRLYLIVTSLLLLGVAAGLVLNALSDKIVFFFSPTEITAKPPSPGKVVRLGGLVESGSLRKLDNAGTISFTLTDLKKSVNVNYRGILPDLFREGQGVVVQGSFNNTGQFVAIDVLAKHDEKYMPPEVAKALKASGRWEETAGQVGSSQVGSNANGSIQ